MKKITLLLVLLAVQLTYSCNDDNNSSVNNGPATMAGKWNLVNQSGGFQGQNIDIEPGAVVWTFNTTDQKIAINNTSGNQDGISFPTATYNYYMLPNNVSPQTCSNTLNLEEMDLGCVSIDGNTMIITPVGADMFTLTFTR